MNRPQVAIFVPSLRGGGAERSAVNLAHGMAARGIRVDLVLADAVGPFLSLVDENVRLVDLSSRRVSLSLIPLARYLRREQPGCLIPFLEHANVVASIAKQLARVKAKLVLTTHNMPSYEATESSSFKEAVVMRLARPLYPKADDVVAVSQGVADDLAEVIRMRRDRIHVIYGAVVDGEIAIEAAKSTGHPWLDHGDRPVVLAVGRLSRAKDYPTLLRAFQVVRKAKPTRLVILGEGEERDKLERMSRALGLSEDMDMPGFVSNPFAFMARSAVFVHCSQWEGLPGVLPQAMACGTPIVATDSPGGVAEALGGGRYGSLVPVGDSESLAGAILDAVDPPQRHEDLLARAADFSIDKVTEQYVKMIGLEEEGE